MKDLWLLIIGDMPSSYQWAGAVVGLILALLLLAIGGFGAAPPRPIKHGFTEPIFTMPGASLLTYVDRHVGTVVNVGFWLVAGPLTGYLVAVIIYLTWPWCIAVVAVLAGLTWVINRWWNRRMGLE